MPGLPKSRKKPGPPAASKVTKRKVTKRDAADPGTAIVQQVGDLGWTGQHGKAVELASAALAKRTLTVQARLDLLDLRAESCIALGDLDAAADGRRTRCSNSRGARASPRSSRRRSTGARWSRSALAAPRMRASRRRTRSSPRAQAKRPDLEALALFRLAEAEMRQRSQRSARRSRQISRSRSTGNSASRCGEGRAWWAAFCSLQRTGEGCGGRPGRCQSAGTGQAQRRPLGRGQRRQHAHVQRAGHYSPPAPVARIAGGLRSVGLRRAPGHHHAQHRRCSTATWASTGARAGCCSTPAPSIAAPARCRP